MRSAIVAGAVAAAFLAPPAAHACTTQLPAPSANHVPISVVKVDEDAERTALRVCAGRREHELARGTWRDRRRGADGVRIGAASAAGNRVAWIEERSRGVARETVVTVARVGREVRVLRRFTATRQRTSSPIHIDVLLTRAGDLAWSAGGYDVRGSLVAVDRPGERPRRLASYAGSGLALEDGRTLRWYEGDFFFDFFDLRPIDCRKRSRYTPWAQNDQVLVTRAQYHGSTVVRGCDVRSGRDRVLIQNYSDVGAESELTFVGLDREWAVFHQAEYWRDGGGPATVTVIDARTGRQSSGHTYNGESVPQYPVPVAGAPFAVTAQGVAGWVRGEALYALVDQDTIVRLDAGAIGDLRADGDALVWTRDGVPQRWVR